MLYANGRIFTPEGYVFGGMRVENGRIAAILPGLTAGDMDLGGRKVLPGLVDIHIHGCAGADFSDTDENGLARMSRYLAERGVTAFAPTSMTLSYERLTAAFAAAARLHADPVPGGARVVGIHMEGPFLSEKKKGAQNGAHLRAPDPEAFQRLYEGCGGLIRLVDLAPELPGAVDFTRYAAKLCGVSVAHTDAGYETAAAVFDAGASHLTHLFNAMPPIHHRQPGVIGAASERESVTAELICDGIHVHPSAVRMAFRLFPGRLCLVSDALRCCGMPEGEYELGGQRAFLRRGAAYLADGTLAGAASDLMEDLRRAVSFGIPEAEAIRAATILPAREIGAGDSIGSLELGKRADFLVCGEDLSPETVYLGGERITG